MMAGNAHTPGPWKWDGCSLSDFSREWPCSMSMEWIPNGRYMDTDGEQVNERVEADGRLIAAAPDLLEALEGLLDGFPLPDTTNEYELIQAGCDPTEAHKIAKARAAIARAKGEAQ